jgi:hypothetical protein
VGAIRLIVTIFFHENPMDVFHEGINEIKLINVESGWMRHKKIASSDGCLLARLLELSTKFQFGDNFTLQEWNMIGFTDKRARIKPKELMPRAIIVSRFHPLD